MPRQAVQAIPTQFNQLYNCPFPLPHACRFTFLFCAANEAKMWMISMDWIPVGSFCISGHHETCKSAAVQIQILHFHFNSAANALLPHSWLDLEELALESRRCKCPQKLNTRRPKDHKYDSLSLTKPPRKKKSSFHTGLLTPY